jgi:hypothetical protein
VRFHGAGVLAAQAGAGVLGLEPAAAAVGEGEGTAADVFGLGGAFGGDGMGRVMVGSGGDGGLCHFGPRSLGEMDFCRDTPPTPWGSLHSFERKGVTKKGVCKLLKRKGGFARRR